MAWPRPEGRGGVDRGRGRCRWRGRSGAPHVATAATAMDGWRKAGGRGQEVVGGAGHRGREVKRSGAGAAPCMDGLGRTQERPPRKPDHRPLLQLENRERHDAMAAQVLISRRRLIVSVCINIYDDIDALANSCA